MRLTVFSYIKVLIFNLILGVFVIIFTHNALAAPTITNASNNISSYTNSQIPKYEKLEINFQILNSSATNTFFPYDTNPPPGLPANTGITVNAIFTDPNGNTFNQPAFLYQDFDYQVKSGKEWFYPTNNYSWRVRFSPNLAGNWKYKITAQDASGATQSNETFFTVVNSANKGLIQVALHDPRYFEFNDGSYFPALGYNLPEGVLDNISPQSGNQAKLQTMSADGMDFSRVWVSMYSIYGEAYAGWDSPNKVHQTQEPRYGIVNPINSFLTEVFTTYYPGQTPPTPPTGSEYYMWLEFNKTITAGLPPELSMQRFTPCRFINNIAVKQNTNYKIRVHYATTGLEGPLDSSKPYGFAVKRSTNALPLPIDSCNDPNTAGLTTIAGTYNASQVQNDSVNNGWKYLEGTYNSGANDYLGYLYLTFDNVKSTNSDPVAGQIFIDKVWLEESSCTSNCVNLIDKPDMNMHTYISQQNAYNFDKFMSLAKQYGMYIKAVMNEKNDRILGTIDFNGQPTANQSVTNFYGNGTSITKVRWLEEAWWRYMQARWGYSPNIHSWELLNEGDASNNHLVQADEFGKYMHCRVFGVATIIDSVLGNKCNLNHPNSHLVTTSFSGQMYPWQFWNNGGSAASYKLYRDIDYADQHYYANVEDTSVLASYYDSALFSYNLSTANNFSDSTKKPFVRGETAWNSPADAYLGSNQDRGEWLHDYIWAGLNNGGLMEHFFAGGNLTKQIYDLRANPPYDNRPMFKKYSDFVKDIPLNNGLYQDVSAVASATNARVWGQKDLTNKRAHFWVANKNHTWYNVLGGYSGGPQPIPVGSLTTTITIGGFTPNTSYPIVWWNTYTGLADNALGSPVGTITSNSTGNLTLNVSSLISDAAVKIGNYPAQSSPSPLPGDINLDGNVNILDFTLLSNSFGSSSSVSDLNSDGVVNILDYTILSNNFGRSN